MIDLRVSQGSILEPLFFLNFCNDLTLFLDDISSLLFADDTTLYLYGPDFDTRLNLMKKLTHYLNGAVYNRIVVNPCKMFIIKGCYLYT